MLTSSMTGFFVFHITVGHYKLIFTNKMDLQDQEHERMKVKIFKIILWIVITILCIVLFPSLI